MRETATTNSHRTVTTNDARPRGGWEILSQGIYFSFTLTALFISVMAGVYFYLTQDALPKILNDTANSLKSGFNNGLHALIPDKICQNISNYLTQRLLQYNLTENCESRVADWLNSSNTIDQICANVTRNVTTSTTYTDERIGIFVEPIFHKLTTLAIVPVCVTKLQDLLINNLLGNLCQQIIDGFNSSQLLDQIVAPHCTKTIVALKENARVKFNEYLQQGIDAFAPMLEKILPTPLAALGALLVTISIITYYGDLFCRNCMQRNDTQAFDNANTNEQDGQNHQDNSSQAQADSHDNGDVLDERTPMSPRAERDASPPIVITTASRTMRNASHSSNDALDVTSPRDHNPQLTTFMYSPIRAVENEVTAPATPTKQLVFATSAANADIRTGGSIVMSTRTPQRLQLMRK